MKISLFLANKSQYLGNGTKQLRSIVTVVNYYKKAYVLYRLESRGLR